MGAWEDALKEAAAQRYAEVQSLQRQRAQVDEQARALIDFIDGMNRLGIRPQRQPFLRLKLLPDRAGYRASLTRLSAGTSARTRSSHPIGRSTT